MPRCGNSSASCELWGALIFEARKRWLRYISLLFVSFICSPYRSLCSLWKGKTSVGGGGSCTRQLHFHFHFFHFQFNFHLHLEPRSYPSSQASELYGYIDFAVIKSEHNIEKLLLFNAKISEAHDRGLFFLFFERQKRLICGRSVVDASCDRNRRSRPLENPPFILGPPWSPLHSCCKTKTDRFIAQPNNFGTPRSLPPPPF